MPHIIKQKAIMNAFRKQLKPGKKKKLNIKTETDFSSIFLDKAH